MVVFYAAGLKEMEISFQWNEHSILICLCIVCCSNMENMSEVQLYLNLSPPPAQKKDTQKSPHQNLLNHTNVPKIYILMKTVAMFIYLEPH